VISDADIQPLAADLFRVRIPAAMAHALNCYLWLGPDGVTVVDTGWADSAPVIAHAVEQLGQRTVTSNGSCLVTSTTTMSARPRPWRNGSPSAVVAGRADTPFIRGAEPGPWPGAHRSRTGTEPADAGDGGAAPAVPC
jgi:hypothetical protein